MQTDWNVEMRYAANTQRNTQRNMDCISTGCHGVCGIFAFLYIGISRVDPMICWFEMSRCCPGAPLYLNEHASMVDWNVCDENADAMRPYNHCWSCDAIEMFLNPMEF